MMTKLAFTLWYVWKARNEAIFKHKSPHPAQLVGRLKGAIDEFHSVQAKKQQVRALKPRDPSHIPATWQRPTDGVIKINVDGSFIKETWEAGIAGIARDSLGRVIGGFGKSSVLPSAEIAEALAVLEASLFAKEMGWQRIAVETDSDVVFSALQTGTGSVDWKLRRTMRDISSVKSNFAVFQVHLVRRSANRCADFLAQSYRQKTLPSNWVESHPASLVRLLEADFSGCTFSVGD